MSKSSELAACPFCSYNDVVLVDTSTTAPFIHFARCTFCWAHGPKRETRAEAIAAWNGGALREECERLRGENERLRNNMVDIEEACEHGAFFGDDWHERRAKK